MYKIIVAIEILILIFIWPFLLIPSFMMFDAPNSTTLIIPWVLAGAVWSYPLFITFGLGLAYLKRKSGNSTRKLILLPLLSIVLLVIMLSVMIFNEWLAAPSRIK